MKGRMALTTGTCLLILAWARAAKAQGPEKKLELAPVQEPKVEKPIEVKVRIPAANELFRLEAWERVAPATRIVGPIHVAGYHVPPGRDSGPFKGPPCRIYGVGFGASLWRDWVTGLPLS